MAGTRTSRRRRLRIPEVAPVVRFGAMFVAFVLGAIGFRTAYHDLGHAASLLLIVTQSLRLIVGAFPAALDDRDLPLNLEIARIALPLLTIWTTVALAWVQIRNPLRLALANARGEHLIVSGDSGLAALIARSELEAGRQVIVWADDPNAPWVSEAVELGAGQIAAKGSDGEIAKLGIDKARSVLILGDNDAANVARTAAVLDAAARLRPAGNPLAVIARVDDLDFRHRVEERFERQVQASARLRFASLPDVAARQLFVDAPLDAFTRAGATARPIFVLGLTPAVERYLRRILVGGHFRDGIKPRVVVVSHDPARTEEDFRSRNGSVDALSPMVFEAGQYDRPNRLGALLDSLCQRHGNPISIIVDCLDDPVTLSAAMAIEDAFRDRDLAEPPIHVRLSSGHDQRLGVMIRPFGSLEQFADPDLLTQEAHDELARSIHEFYLEGRLSEGDRIGSRASMREWEDLPERFRDDNRFVADCYQLKLRDVGAREVERSGPPLRFEPDELEELSRSEHDRWMAAKLADGWKYGADRDDTARIHPDIVPYDSLSERIKDLDREQIRVMTRLLAAHGKRAVRVLNVALRPGHGIAPPLAPLLDQLLARYPDRMVLFTTLLTDRSWDAALAGANGDYGVRLIAVGSIQRSIDELAADSRAPTAELVRRADSLVAASASCDSLELLLDDAQLVVGYGDEGVQGDNRSVRLAPDGSVTVAPWLS